jgi:hypothetical protein
MGKGKSAEPLLGPVLVVRSRLRDPEAHAGLMIAPRLRHSLALGSFATPPERGES